jgi:hypothetical protein
MVKDNLDILQDQSNTWIRFANRVVLEGAGAAKQVETWLQIIQPVQTVDQALI